MDNKLDDLIPSFGIENIDFNIEETSEEVSTTEEDQSQEEEKEETQDFRILTPKDLETTTDEDEEEEDSTEDSTPPEDAELVGGIFKSLKERGIFVDDEENPFDNTWSSLEERFDNLQSELYQKGLNDLYEATPDIGKAVLEYIFTKDQLTREDLADFFKAHLQDTEDLSAPTDPEAYLRNYYQSQGVLKQPQIDVLIEALNDEDESGEAIKEQANLIYEREKESRKASAQAKIEEAKVEKAAREKRQREFATAVGEALEETKWRPAFKNEIRKDISTGRHVQTLQQAFQSPKALLQLATLARMYDPKTGEFNLEPFVKQVASKDIKRTKDSALKDNFTSVSSKSKGSTSGKDSNVKDKYTPLAPLF